MKIRLDREQEKIIEIALEHYRDALYEMLQDKDLEGRPAVKAEYYSVLEMLAEEGRTL